MCPTTGERPAHRVADLDEILERPGHQPLAPQHLAQLGAEEGEDLLLEDVEVVAEQPQGQGPGLLLQGGDLQRELAADLRAGEAAARGRSRGEGDDVDEGLFRGEGLGEPVLLPEVQHGRELIGHPAPHHGRTGDPGDQVRQQVEELLADSPP